MPDTTRSLIDIIIPTMWKAPILLDALRAYAASTHVGKIVLIDNNAADRPSLEDAVYNRLTIIDHGRNIFVNPAWNEGVSLCKSEVICIANDDIQIDEELFQSMILLDWSYRKIDIIGLGTRGEKEGMEILKVEINKSAPLGGQIPTFGACMFMPRKNYAAIPEPLKIWFGDDYLAHSNPNTYVVKTSHVTGSMSTTINSFDQNSDVHAAIRQDIDWAKANLLEKSETPQEANVDISKELQATGKQESISLDLGCGTNPQNPFKADRLIGIDSQCASANIISCWVGFEPIPLEDSCVDFVTAYDFIEHIPRFAMRERPFNPFIDAMSEIWRVLKPNGMFFSRTPAYPSAAAFQDPTHVNIITDQTVSYFAKRPCTDGSLIDPWGLPLGKRYGFKGEFLLIKQWWDSTHLCWQMIAIKE